MNINDYDYELDEHFIAQKPIENRCESKLMIMNKNTGEIEHTRFYNIKNYLNKGDVLVLNNTKVLPARIMGKKKDTGANIEILLLKNINDDIWECLARPGKRLHVGTEIVFNEKLMCTIINKLEDGIVRVEFKYQGIFLELIEEIGLMPLPPYIHESLKDKDRYQTVYAKYRGSAAAGTAGLHFTDEFLDRIKEKGVDIANVTLHVGIGTFRPVKETEVEKHKMHSEHFYIKEEDCEKINKAKREGHRVICVGTTSCRVLESISDDKGFVKPTEGDTQIYIYPGYKFKCLDALITNFHLPESTLIMLVSALAGREFVLEAYKEAVKEKYRFFSFGDAMFIH